MKCIGVRVCELLWNWVCEHEKVSNNNKEEKKPKKRMTAWDSYFGLEEWVKTWPGKLRCLYVTLILLPTSTCSFCLALFFIIDFNISIQGVKVYTDQLKLKEYNITTNNHQRRHVCVVHNLVAKFETLYLYT